MRAALRLLPLLALLALGACGGGGHYAGRPLRYAAPSDAPTRYAPPGPPTDPWGPYIREASARYAVPETWVRAVMRQESGGHQYLNGAPITSGAGAMGLMQIMPATYAMLRDRYGLGDDPYDPHDNIAAGTAYIAELNARYGAPAFLAAYNAGPRALEDYYAGRRRALPAETVAYMAAVGPRLSGVAPDAAQYALARRPAPVLAAPVEVAEAPLAPPQAPPRLVAAIAPAPPPPRAGGFRLFTPAYADTVARDPTPRWGVQVGAFADPGQARGAAEAARAIAPAELAPAQTVLGPVARNGGTLYRARLTGITQPAADTACSRLHARAWDCLTVPPGG